MVVQAVGRKNGSSSGSRIFRRGLSAKGTALFYQIDRRIQNADRSAVGKLDSAD
jgi:hypothetical protein